MGSVCAVTSRRPRAVLARVSVVAAAVPGLLVAASPAYAVNRQDGDQPGPGISTAEGLLTYVALPIGLFLVVALLVYAPSIARGPRYRPGLSWFAAPVWFNGPDNPESAVSAVETTRAAGGASARW